MENFNEILETANNGDALAQYKIARAYEKGDGVEKSIETALEWYKKSAENGYENAINKLKILAVEPQTSTETTPQNVRSYVAPPVNDNGNFGGATTQSGGNLTNASKSKTVAALLAFFLGCYGIHDFYLGYKKNGIIKIVLTLTVIGSFVSIIWSLIDLIKILTNGKVDSNGNQLK